MSILRYTNQVKERKISRDIQRRSGLSNNEASAIEAVLAAEKKPRRKSDFSFAEKVEIGDYARKYGKSNAMRKFDCSYNSIKKYHDAVVQTIKDNPDMSISEISEKDAPALAPNKGGHPGYLPKGTASKVVGVVKGLRRAGAPVNDKIIAGVIKGALIGGGKADILSEHGGVIKPKVYARSFRRKYLQELSWRKQASKRRPNAAQHLHKCQFRLSVNNLRRRYNIPAPLVVNLDETSSKYVPVPNYTYDERGSKEIRVVGAGDKRGISETLSGSLAGDFLPVQLIYGGTTRRCLPNTTLAPDDFEFVFTKTHWASAETCLDEIEDIIQPYIEEKKNQLSLEVEQKALIIFDGWIHHRSDEYYDAIRVFNGLPLQIPFGLTDECQGMDVSVNKPWKDLKKSSFIDYIAEVFVEQTSQGIAPEEVKFDLRLSNIKNRHLSWTVDAYNYMKNHPDIIANGMAKSLGMSSFNRNREIERFGINF